MNENIDTAEQISEIIRLDQKRYDSNAGGDSY